MHGAPPPSRPPQPADAPKPGAGQAPARQPWSFALFALITCGAIIVVALSAPFVVDPLLRQVPELLGLTDAAAIASAMAWAHLLSFQATVVALTAMMAGVGAGVGSRLGWRAPTGRFSWLQPLIVMILVSAVTTILAFTFFADIVQQDLAPFRRMLEGVPLWLAFLSLAVGAPLSEELLFRGYLLHRLKQTRLGFLGGALVANVGWTMLHYGYSWLSMADVFLAGLLLSWALWRTGSIWVPIAFHALYNAAVFAILLIPSTDAAVPAHW